MAKQGQVADALKTGESLTVKPASNTLQTLLNSINVKERFKEMLGEKSAGFMSSILSVTNQSKMLSIAEPMTIISAAAIAASLDLPINPSLGFAHIVPYKDNKTGKVIAQFQMGWKGYVQLAMRSGQYKTMNVSEVYEGELTKNNRITGEMDFNLEGKISDKIIGYVAYFKLLNGFEKYCYITDENLEKHGARYSKSYDSGQWSKTVGGIKGEFMKKKTVIKNLLSKFGILSIAMTKAITTDQGVMKEIDGAVEYPDSTNIEALPETGEISGEELAKLAEKATEANKPE